MVSLSLSKVRWCLLTILFTGIWIQMEPDNSNWARWSKWSPMIQMEPNADGSAIYLLGLLMRWSSLILFIGPRWGCSGSVARFISWSPVSLFQWRALPCAPHKPIPKHWLPHRCQCGDFLGHTVIRFKTICCSGSWPTTTSAVGSEVFYLVSPDLVNFSI